jgi:MFS family permease
MSSSPNWFNRTVLGAGLTSFLADVGYELAVALLPAFLLVLHLPERSAGLVLGIIEATAEFLSNAAKLAVGWYTDRIGRRKGLVVFGYALTGSAFALCALAVSWPLVLVAKSLAWLGKGIRGPLRNAILADAVDPAQRGKAFGFHRAGDSLGSVLGPLLGWFVIYQLPADWFTTPDAPFRAAFWFTLVPGLGSAVAFALLVREQRFTPKPGLRLGASVRALPKPFGKFLIGIGMFGLGDFAHTLLILMATADLSAAHGLKSAAEAGVLFYAWRNFWATLAAFPAGWLGDKFGHVSVLVVGYLIAAGTMAGFAVLVESGGGSLIGWAALFALAGVYLAIEEALEPAIVPELVPDPAVRGTAFGVLATVNGLGDVAASLMVGVLFRYVGPAAGLAYAAILMASGAAWMASIRLRARRYPG